MLNLPAQKRWMEADDNDYSDLEPGEIVCLKAKAKCFSEACAMHKRKGQDGVLKLVAKGADWCPDCGHALFWEKYAA